MTLKDALLPVTDTLRGLAGILGFRPYKSIVIRKRIYSGSRVGLGTFHDVDKVFTVAKGTQVPRVQQYSPLLFYRELRSFHEIVGGNKFQEGDLVIGPITPKYPGGGYDIQDFQPPTIGQPTEIYFKIIGPGTAPDGDWYEKVGDKTDKSLRYLIVARKTGKRLVG